MHIIACDLHCWVITLQTVSRYDVSDLITLFRILYFSPSFRCIHIIRLSVSCAVLEMKISDVTIASVDVGLIIMAAKNLMCATHFFALAKNCCTVIKFFYTKWFCTGTFCTFDSCMTLG